MQLLHRLGCVALLFVFGSACGETPPSGDASIDRAEATVTPDGDTADAPRDAIVDRAPPPPGQCNALYPCERLGSLANACVEGQCVWRDGAREYRLCDGRDTDVQSSREHCGACGHACSDTRVCLAGICGACPAGTAACDRQTCQRLDRDTRNCGACGNVCSPGARCEGGVCIPCPEGTHGCAVDNLCHPNAPPTTDDCDGCGLQCPSRAAFNAVCRAMRCAVECIPGAASCASGDGCETLLAVDDAHCGACGRACEVGSRCVGGACVATRTRMVAPISGLAVTSARPWFRWAPDASIEEVRVQVCPTRDCARVEAEWSTRASRTQSPVTLSRGLHFWRVFARRGADFEAVASAPWSFIVPDGPRGGMPGTVSDLDGDGSPEALRFVADSASAHPRWRVEVTSSARATTSTLPGDQDTSAVEEGRTTRVLNTVTSLPFLGDINGDGFGELGAVIQGTTENNGTATFFASAALRWFGGPGGPTSSGQQFAEAAWGGVASFRTIRMLAAIGDFDGDGYGDVLTADDGMGSTSLMLARGGREPTRAATLLNAGCLLNPLVVGDFDGDGRNEIILSTCVHTTPFTTHAVLGSAGRLYNLTGCAGVARLMTSGVSWMSVADDDLDGYDDLRFGPDAYFRGGPDGLSAARCTAPPAMP